jgi:hypothetical protein
MPKRRAEGMKADHSPFFPWRKNVTHSADRELSCWLSFPEIHPKFTLLSEIALRLERLICSEASNERTIGQQRRFLMPHRRCLSPDLLLVGTGIEEIQQPKL